MVMILIMQDFLMYSDMQTHQIEWSGDDNGDLVIIMMIMLTVMMMTISHLVSVAFKRVNVVLDPLQSHCL